MSWKIAFVGLRHGHIGTLYDRLKTDSRFEITAICEEDAEARKVAAESWKIEATHSSFAEMMENVDFDILAIGDYYGIRGERAIAGLKNGKHILSDKPLCTDLAELAEIRKLAAEKNLVIGEMLDLRDFPCIRAAKELIDSGAVGEINAINFGGQHPLNYGTRPGWYFEEGKHGGTINDIAIHGLDIVEYLTGHRITDLIAARCWNAFATEVPGFKDSAQLMFALDNNCGCIADVSYAAPSKIGFSTPLYWRFTLWGSKGVAEFSPKAETVRFYESGNENVRDIAAEKDIHSDYLDIFVNELEGKKEPFGTEHLLKVTEDALMLQKLAD